MKLLCKHKVSTNIKTRGYIYCLDRKPKLNIILIKRWVIYMIKKYYLFLLILLFNNLTLFAQKPIYNIKEKEWEKHIPDSTALNYSVFLIGDVGYKKIKEKSYVLSALQKQLSKANNNDILIFLGDNITGKQAFTKHLTLNKSKQKIIKEQLALTDYFKGKTFFISGEQDWKNGETILDLERQLIDSYNHKTTFIPSQTDLIVQKSEINANLLIISIQSALLLDKNVSGERKQSAYTEIGTVIRENSNKNIILLQHHPLYATGVHGGYFSLKDHIFPFTSLHKDLYIPLPILGSFYPIIWQYGISRQDLNSPSYQDMIESLSKIIANKKNLIVASGHEHALQLLKDGNINQIISGSGSLKSRVFNVYPALFGIGDLGYAKLNYYSNGQCWVEFYTINKNEDTSNLVYRKALYALKGSQREVLEEKSIDYKDSIKLISAGTEYATSQKKHRTIGKQYRASWAAPVHVRYLDLTREKHGLEATKSNDSILFLQDSMKKLYTFRLINRNPHDLLPKGFDATVVEDIVKDQTSTSQPFGALVVDYLAKKANLTFYDTQLFYLPYSRLLKDNLSDFGGKIGLLEKGLNDDQLIATDSLYSELENNLHTKVDQNLFLKNRLFDFLIGDYHRDESTWLWQANQYKDQIIYTPVTKHRIQFFTKIDGYVPSFLRKLVPEVQVFGYQIKDPAKLSISARNLDRNLLNALSEQDWINTVNELTKNISDEDIINAVKQLPKESYNLDGKEIINKLIARRNKLKETALKYFDILAKDVRIVGTNYDDLVTVNRKKDSTDVSLRYFNRSFSNKKTQQLEVFTLGGKDTLKITGWSRSPIKIRSVGGEGIDYVENLSKNKSLFIYDNYNTKLRNTRKSRLILTNERWVNDFSRNDFIYNKSSFAPNAMIYNATDFISIGFSHIIKNRGFKKEPFAFEQKTGVLIAPKTGALELRYLSSFYSLFGNNTDLVISGHYIGPAYDFNFYGIGNSSENKNKLKYYQVRSKNAHVKAYLQKRISDNLTFGVGPGLAYYKLLKQEEDSYLSQYNIANPRTDLFLNISSYLNFDFSDNIFYPTKGWRWTNSANFYAQTNNERYQFANLTTDFRLYQTPFPNIPFTMAFRFGGSTNIGKYNFYHANTIGNLTNLRGYRADRFSGRSTLYTNLEGRLKLTKIQSYFLAGDIGIFGFYDTGRVFSNAVESNKWHNGYGPGLWINFFDQLLISIGYGLSSEDRVFSLNIGYRF